MNNLIKSTAMKYSTFNRTSRAKALLCAAIFMISLGVWGQNRTAYFLDGTNYNHELNPALTPETGYFSMPFLGNLGVETQGNVGYKTFIFKLDGNSKYSQTTFMSPTVSSDDFLGGLEDNNIARLRLNVTILSAGFKAWGGYNSIGLTLRSKNGMNIPYEMYEFMKVQGEKAYSIKDVNMQTKNYAELALGHSRQINDQLKVGANLKFLFGLAYAEMNFDRLDVNLSSGDQWVVKADGTADLSMGGEFTQKDGDATKVGGYDAAGMGMRGFGMAIDLGATYDLSEAVTEGLTVSGSLTDLGFISWNKTANGYINPDDPYIFKGFDNLGIHTDSQNKTLHEQFQDQKDDLEDFFTLRNGGEKSKTTGIGATLNLAGEYKMPFYDKLSAGLLFSHCFDGVYSWTECRVSANVEPTSWFDAALSVGVNTFGGSFGLLANIHCPGFNFFVGTDCFPGKTTKQYIPLDNLNASVNMGINFTFGGGSKD